MLAKAQKLTKKKGILGKHGAVRFAAHIGAGRRHIFRAGDTMFEHRGGTLKDYLAPNGFFNRNFGVIHIGFFRKPVIVIGQAAYKFIKLEHGFFKTGIVPSAA